jgi:hypothetical protein
MNHHLMALMEVEYRHILQLMGLNFQMHLIKREAKTIELMEEGQEYIAHRAQYWQIKIIIQINSKKGTNKIPKLGKNLQLPLTTFMILMREVKR